MRLPDLDLSLVDIDLGGIDAEADARLADYFIRTPHVEALLAGTKSLFLGRKGSGKSAMFTQLPRLYGELGKGEVVLSLTPDEYAWAALKSYEEQGLMAEQAHTNAWRLSILIELAAHLTSLKREWSPAAVAARDRIAKFVDDNFGSTVSIAKTASSLLKGLEKFNFSAFGFGIGIDRTVRSEHPQMTPAATKALMDELQPLLDEQSVVIAFDRLDDSWDGSGESKNLIVGLLKASKDLNDAARRAGGIAPPLRVIVFLRSDIYETLQFDDKDKHRVSEQFILWRVAELEAMLEARLPTGVTVPEIFERGDMRGAVKPFSYIVKRTFLRPREVLQFISTCIDIEGRAAREIAKETVRKAEVIYSRWKVADLKQEYAKIWSFMDGLIEVLRQEYNRYDSIKDLEVLFEKKVPHLAEVGGPRFLLQILFDSSIIGIRVGNSGAARFTSEDSTLVLPASGALYVHQGLHQGLNIIERRSRGS